MKIPLVDLSRVHLPHLDEFLVSARRTIERGDFVLGGAVAEFENAFAEFAGTAHAIGVGSGTDALEVALRSAGLDEGDGVILPTNTFFATAAAVVRAGGRVILADCREDDFMIEPSSAGNPSDARFIIPVHLYGLPADMEAIDSFASDHGLIVIEDAAQAHGASFKGRACGSMGLAAGFSFFPGKNLGALGDGGAVTTNSPEIAERARAIRNYGSPQKYHHPRFGFNSRLDTLQAAFLLPKLRRLAEWNEERRRVASFYIEALSGIPGLILPRRWEDREGVFHLFVVRIEGASSEERGRVLSDLNGRGIGAGIHYPVPIHLHGAFEYLGHARGDFPVAERLMDEIISLPIFPGMREDEAAYVVEGLKEALR